MDRLLFFLSWFGVLHGLLLAFIFYRKRDLASHNRWLAALFAFLALVLLEITVSNVFTGFRDIFLEVLEYTATFAAGPLVYLFAVRLLERPDLPERQVIAHFLPAGIYLAVEGIAWGTGAHIHLSVLVPLVHFQLYTVWLVVTLWREELIGGGGRDDDPHRWLVLIGGLLLLIHAAQWLRYAFSGVEDLRLLVPAVTFFSFYLLTGYGLYRSDLFGFARKYRGNRLTDDQLREHANSLQRLLDEEAVHTSPALSLETLGNRMEIPPHLLSQVINHALGMNFNELINRYRVESARRYLKDPGCYHLTIEAIAERAGFNSRSSFYTAFKRETGCTPSEFREKP